MQLEQVKEFAKKYPNFRNCTIQTFDDCKERWDKTLAKIIPIEQWWLSKCEELNKKWAWIFFSVNSMTSWKRSKADVTWINAWVVECDESSKEDQMLNYSLAWLEPSMIIESNKSLHAYYFAKDWTIDNWAKIWMWLKEKFNWDVTVAKDISRVLRIPWFNHNKDLNNPFLVNLIDINWNMYTEEQMMKEFPYEETKQEEYKPVKKDKWDIWTELTSWNTRQMLLDLSWSPLMNWEYIEFKKNSNWTEQIICNGKMTWCWLDKNDLIWSSDKWWPTWIQWIMYYWNVDKSELLRYCKDRYTTKLEWFEEKKVIKELKEIKTEKIKFNHKQKNPYTWGLKTLDEKFWVFEYRELCILLWYPWMWKTEFAFFVSEANAKQWNKVMFFSLELPIEDMLMRKARKVAWVSKINFQKWETTLKQREIMDKELERLQNIKWVDLRFLQSPTIDNLEEEIKKAKSEWYNLFIIDNLGKIDRQGKDENEWFDIISSRLQDLKNEIANPILLLHHFKKPWKEWIMTPWWSSWFRWSQKLMDNCSLMMEIWRDRDEDNEIEKIKKQVWLHNYKDTMDWTNAKQEFYFDEWTYKEEFNW